MLSDFIYRYSRSHGRVRNIEGDGIRIGVLFTLCLVASLLLVFVGVYPRLDRQLVAVPMVIRLDGVGDAVGLESRVVGRDFDDVDEWCEWDFGGTQALAFGSGSVVQVDSRGVG